MNLAQQKVVIIGGSSGIGFATAKLALEYGAEVIIASRSKAKLQHANERLDGRAKTYAVDARDSEALNAMFQQIGPFDHLQLPGSEVSFAAFADMPLEDAYASFESKFWGPYKAVKAALPYLNKSGSVTLFSGVLSQMPRLAGAHIAAAVNSAIEGLGRALAFQLAPIRVNTLSPGLTKTEIFDDMDETEQEAFFTEFYQRQILPRTATPEEMAQHAVQLMFNGYQTASTVFVDGGLTFR